MRGLSRGSSKFPGILCESVARRGDLRRFPCLENAKIWKIAGKTGKFTLFSLLAAAGTGIITIGLLAKGCDVRMADYIYQLPAPEVVSLPGHAARALIREGNGTAALLYIYILAGHGALDCAQAARDLKWTTAEVDTAAGALVRDVYKRQDLALRAGGRPSTPGADADAGNRGKWWESIRKIGASGFALAPIWWRRVDSNHRSQ